MNGARFLKRSAELSLAGAIALLAASPVLAAPSPSPTLDTVLAAPTGSGYVRESTVFPAVQGAFEEVDYLGVLTPRKPSETFKTLKEDGFVQGYGMAWNDRATGHVLVQLVVAFAGGAGAARWLPEARALSQDTVYFKNDIAVSGIDQQYGGHFANPAGPEYADEIGFIKGNDYFLVDLISAKDDMADEASKQAKHQYDFAPNSTIPPAQWPENASSHTSVAAFNVAASPMVWIAAGAGLLLLLAGVLAFLLIGLGRRGRADMAGEPTRTAFQMSADGNYWWDGQAWRYVLEAAPPGALRSPDGSHWWDGVKWRELARAPGPAGPPPPAATTTPPTDDVR